MPDKTNTKQVFVGSSTEGKLLADKVVRLLNDEGLSSLPWFDFFKAERPPLQELEHLTLRADAAVLIATADDEAIIRQKQWHQMRDNVLFEYGLFAGTIGRAKCGLILPNTEDFRIPSDFLGVACFETFDGRNIEKAAILTVKSLLSTLNRPQRPETTEVRGRRLLSLIGWVRDESLRLVQDWDSERGRQIVTARIIAVSGFLREDIDQLALHKEYAEVEKALLDGIDNCPELEQGFEHDQDLQRAMEDMMRGCVSPNRRVLDGFLYMYDRAGIPTRSNSDCDCCRYWRDRYGEPYWYNDYSFHRHVHSLGACGPFGYAVGVAEAATVFEQLSRWHVRRLKTWSNQFVPPLNDAVAKFERKLHEQIFGSL